MAILKIGKNINAADYWSKRAYSSQHNKETKGDNIEGAYHTHRLKMINELIKGCDFDGCVCLDVGCGDGVMMEYLGQRGAEVIGFDIDEGMIQGAKKRLEDRGICQVQFTK